MSLFDDYEAEIQVAKDFPFGVPSPVWHSANGDIEVGKMTSKHIKNCMNIVGEDDPWYGYFKNELERRRCCGG